MPSVNRLTERPPLAPSRDSGRRRVEAILSAASDVFLEKGVAAATMAEIAVRAATHVGSLYRFFPTKQALSDALTERCMGRVREVTARLIERAGVLEPSGFAETFLDLMLELRADRAVAIHLAVDASRGGEGQRHSVSDLMLEACGQAVRTLFPVLSASRAATVAQTLLYFGKMAIQAADDEVAGRPGAVAELRHVTAHYLADQGRGLGSA